MFIILILFHFWCIELRTLLTVAVSTTFRLTSISQQSGSLRGGEIYVAD